MYISLPITGGGSVNIAAIALTLCVVGVALIYRSRVRRQVPAGRDGHT